MAVLGIDVDCRNKVLQSHQQYIDTIRPSEFKLRTDDDKNKRTLHL